MLHQLEEELNVKIVPGTEVMVDVGTHHFVKDAKGSDRVLVPQPSNDPHDPLVRKRHLILNFSLVVFFYQALYLERLARVLHEWIRRTELDPRMEAFSHVLRNRRVVYARLRAALIGSDDSAAH